MSDAISAFGTQLQIGDGGSPEAFTTIAEVVSFSGPGLALDTEDVTNHQSPGGWEESIGTILRSGEITLEINYVPTSPTHDAATGLLAKMAARSVDNYKMIFPDTGSTTWSFAALVTGFEPDAPHDGKLAASVTLKPTGQMTLA